MICGVDLDCLLSDVNRVTVNLGAQRASPCYSAHCETRVACSERAEAAAVKSVEDLESVKSSA